MKRDPDNGMLFGVCAGVAKTTNISAAIIRLAFIFCTLMGFGTPILIYIIMAFVMPVEQKDQP